MMDASHLQPRSPASRTLPYRRWRELLAQRSASSILEGSSREPPPCGDGYRPRRQPCTRQKHLQEEAGGSATETDNLHSLPKRELPLGIVLDACGSWRELAKDAEIRNWRDFLAAAEVARPMLGVSPSAWREACEVLGERQAAITLAAIYQRADEINNAGGYLRSLTDRAREGKFSAWPMVMALLRAKLDAEKTAAQTRGGPPDDVDKREGRLEVSKALLRSLRRPKS